MKKVCKFHSWCVQISAIYILGFHLLSELNFMLTHPSLKRNVRLFQNSTSFEKLTEEIIIWEQINFSTKRCCDFPSVLTRKKSYLLSVVFLHHNAPLFISFSFRLQTVISLRWIRNKRVGIFKCAFHVYLFYSAFQCLPPSFHFLN